MSPPLYILLAIYINPLWIYVCVYSISWLPKCSKASWTGRMMLNPQIEQSTSLSLYNLVADGVMAEVWGPLAMPARIEAISHFGLTFA